VQRQGRLGPQRTEQSRQQQTHPPATHTGTRSPLSPPPPRGPGVSASQLQWEGEHGPGAQHIRSFQEPAAVCNLGQRTPSWWLT